jgi:hypothetical protein
MLPGLVDHIFYVEEKRQCTQQVQGVRGYTSLNIDLTESRPRFDSRRYQIFREVVGLERGPISFVSTTQGLLGKKKSSGFGLENREYGRRISAAPTTRHNSKPSVPAGYKYGNLVF